MSTRTDPAWKYSTRDQQNLSRFTCNFCSTVLNGGVRRVKQHLAGGYRNAAKCPRCPESIREYLAKKKAVKDQMSTAIDIDDMVNDEDYEDEELDGVESNPRARKPSFTQGSSTHGSNTVSNSNQSKIKKPGRKIGPLDCYYTPDPDVVVENRKGKGKQTKIDENDPYRKELRDRAHQKIARWMYDAGIPLNAVNCESFGPMVEAIGQYGPGLLPPTYHQVRVPLLKKEVEHVNKMMEDHKVERAKYGCTLMCDGWTDRRNMTLINFLVSCPKGTMFIESIDASSYSKDGNKMFQLLDKYVEQIGEANVVQVVTDSAAANVLAGKFLEANRPNLFWSPCAAHCLDLMLEDIFKLPSLKKTWERAIGIHGYFYNRPTLLNMMRHFTRRKELIKPAKTRFATAFLTLERFYHQRANLKKMFTSDAWNESKWAKESQEKPPMGFIYEAMDRAKEAIVASFNGSEEKYKEVFKIIDSRWDVQLHRPLHEAGFYLNPQFFYKDPDAFKKDTKIYSGLYTCIQRLNPSVDVQDKICTDLMKYEKAEGLFGLPMAIRQRGSRIPGLTRYDFCERCGFFWCGCSVLLLATWNNTGDNKWASKRVEDSRSLGRFSAA